MSAQPRTSHGACGSLMWGLGRPLQRDCRSRPGSATNQLCIHPYSFQFRRNQLIKVVFSGYVQCVKSEKSEFATYFSFHARRLRVNKVGGGGGFRKKTTVWERFYVAISS